MTQPVNKTIFLDFETSGFQRGIFSRQLDKASYSLEDSRKIMHAYAGMFATQLSVRGQGIDSLHVELSDWESKVPGLGIPITKKGKVRDVVLKDGSKVKGYRAKMTTTSRDDIFNYLSNSKSKLKGAKLDHWMENSSHLYVREQAGLVTDDFFISNWGYDRFIKESAPETISRANARGVNLTQKQFAGDKNIKGSIRNIIEDILAGATASKPNRLKIFNPSFDANFIEYLLRQSGDVNLLTRFKAAVDNNLLIIDDVAKDWQEIVYKLVEDNPDLKSSFRIGNNPEAAFNTGRPLMKVESLSDMRFSTLGQSQEKIVRHLRWHPELASIEGLHNASIDTLATQKISEILEQVKTEAVRRSGHSWDHLLSNKGTGHFVSDAMESIMKQYDPHYGITNLVQGIADESKDSFNFIKSQTVPHFGARKAKITKMSLAKYGGLTAAIGAATLATYFTLNTESDFGEFSHSIKGKGRSRKDSGVRKYFDGEDHVANPMLKNIAAGIGIPMLALAAFGAGAASRHGNKFGLHGKKPETFKEYMQAARRTIRYGIKQVETAVPLSRVFGLGDTIDLIAGSRRLGYQSRRFNKATGSYSERAIRFDVVKGGKVLPMNEIDIGVSTFLNAGKEFNPEHASALDNIFNPTPVKGLDRRIIKITTDEHGRAEVAFEDITENEIFKDGKKVKEFTSKGNSQKVTLDMKITYSKRADYLMNNQFQEIREVQKKLSAGAARQGFQVSKLAQYQIQKDLLDNGYFPKISKKEYLNSLDVPAAIKNNPLLLKAWEMTQSARYHLDLLPKGSGQGTDLLHEGLTRQVNKVRGTINVIGGVGDKFFSTESVKYRAKIGSKLLKSWVTEPINTFLETPFELLGVEAHRVDRVANKLKESSNIASKIFGKGLSIINRPNLGLNTHAMKYGIPEYFFQFGMKRVLPAFAAVQAFSFADHALGKFMGMEGRGPLTQIPIKTFETFSLAYSKVSDLLGLTDIAKRQKEIAPGSTGLGIFAPALGAVTTYRVADYLYKSGPKVFRDKLNALGSNIRENNSWIKSALRKEAYSGALNKAPTEKLFSWLINNPKKGIFAAMMLPMIPFIPGFIGSDKSYKEKKAEYSGKKEVAVRKYRGWMLSSSPFEGAQASQFRRHALNLILSDWENKGVIYPSFTQRFMHNMSLGIYKPHILEEYHKEAQPVYKSAAFGANIPLIGPMIAGTIGQVIPRKTYHEIEESGAYRSGEAGNVSVVKPNQSAIAGYLGAKDQGGFNAQLMSYHNALSDFSGFKGFTANTITQMMTGKRSPDQFTPYAQDAGQMYNPATVMWGYQFGDPTIIGGEFLRRLFRSPDKQWVVNDIPNELREAAWMPQAAKYGYKGKDVTIGTSFDKIPMGWLYGSRKGWEFLYGEETRGKDLNSYSSEVKTEILQQISPFSKQFETASQETQGKALNNQLDPAKEQRYYETVDQVRQLKEKIYAHSYEYAYSVDTENVGGTVEDVDLDSGRFRLQGNDAAFRIAGVSLADQDIRARLLQKNVYSTSEELADAVDEIKANTTSIIQSRMSKGSTLSGQMATIDNLPSNKGGYEFLNKELTQELWDAGAPFADTGKLATHNLAQDRMGPLSKPMAKYWDLFTHEEGYWNRKLNGNRDYIDQYESANIYNKEVKLWYHPVRHIIEPFIASSLSRLGVTMTPSFTEERRANQQYWDVLKYIKYKTLANQAAEDGNENAATFYESKWRGTMIGTDPTDDNTKDELQALPENERRFFNFFANEPDPKKRGKIMSMIPAPAKRIYESVWLKKMADASNNKEIRERFEKIKASEGWDLSESEMRMYQDETGGRTSQGDWARAHFVREYAEEHGLPGAGWSGWRADVNLDNVELLALKEDGEQVQDYGFFDQQIREAAFDPEAYTAAMQVHSVGATSGNMINNMIPYIMQGQSVRNMPTMSTSPIRELSIETNGYSKILQKLDNPFIENMDDHFL